MLRNINTKLLRNEYQYKAKLVSLWLNIIKIISLYSMNFNFLERCCKSLNHLICPFVFLSFYWFLFVLKIRETTLILNLLFFYSIFLKNLHFIYTSYYTVILATIKFLTNKKNTFSILWTFIFLRKLKYTKLQFDFFCCIKEQFSFKLSILNC